ncbi:hypothetical protein [Streptomyces winkii]|uniref:hypothetical protein n=1 Tax=Streptomyces winkii TaxID=3051178 RepID=UPI0028D6C0C0|nr:hypothetical protein [Streptomyces sp. DSM 40971]
MITKEYDGEVHVDKSELATPHGTWGGAAAGAANGIRFPPAAPAAAAVGAAGG